MNSNKTRVTAVTIESKRLYLRLLSAQDYEMYLQDNPALEKKLGLTLSREHLDPATLGTLRWNLKRGQSNLQEYSWYGLWLLVLKDEGRSVGSAGFIGPPDPDGEVELHYGTDSRDRNCGYMSEAVAALCSWAFLDLRTVLITAEISRDNRASQKVVQRCGMTILEENSKTQVWFLKRSESKEISGK